MDATLLLLLLLLEAELLLNGVQCSRTVRVGLVGSEKRRMRAVRRDGWVLWVLRMVRVCMLCTLLLLLRVRAHPLHASAWCSVASLSLSSGHLDLRVAGSCKLASNLLSHQSVDIDRSPSQLLRVDDRVQRGQATGRSLGRLRVRIRLEIWGRQGADGCEDVRREVAVGRLHLNGYRLTKGAQGSRVTKGGAEQAKQWVEVWPKVAGNLEADRVLWRTYWMMLIFRRCRVRMGIRLCFMPAVSAILRDVMMSFYRELSSSLPKSRGRTCTTAVNAQVVSSSGVPRSCSYTFSECGVAICNKLQVSYLVNGQGYIFRLERRG